MRSLIMIGAGLLALAACAASSPSPHALRARGDITLKGSLSRGDHHTYREIPFEVPPGVKRIVVTLEYDHDQRTVVDLGLRDPNGFRGWSGGNKNRIVIGEMDATPSYRAGPILAGTWTLILGVPNIREGVHAAYAAKIALERDGGANAGFAENPLSLAAGWRRGDFHVHTGHSDGACGPDANRRRPCPVSRTLEAAAEAGLDFIAVTDHNTLSQAADLRELQPSFPDLLLVAGEEVTTFFGHANAIGLWAPVDFQLGSPRLPTVDRLLDEVEAQQALLSINHPGQPSNEDCMGCGWTAPNTDYARIAAIEAVNGGSVRAGKAEGPSSGLAFWEQRLNAGYRLTAIGGSDNHDAGDALGARQSPVGSPTTVVFMKELSQQALLEGVRSGRAFIDLAPNPMHRLDLEARASGATALMGGTLALRPGEEAILAVTATFEDGGIVEIVSGGLKVDGRRFRLDAGAQKGWIRANVRNRAGGLVMVGNPIYVAAQPQAR